MDIVELTGFLSNYLSSGPAYIWVDMWKVELFYLLIYNLRLAGPMEIMGFFGSRQSYWISAQTACDCNIDNEKKR